MGDAERVTDAESEELQTFLHIQTQAQRYLRTLLAGIAVFGVSIGSALLNKWNHLLTILPDTSLQVQRTYNVSIEFIQSTNKLHTYFAIILIFGAIIAVLDSARITTHMIRAKLPKYSEENSYTSLDEAIFIQYRRQELAHNLANTAFFLAVIGVTLGVISLAGQAAYLAIIDLFILFVSLAYFAWLLPGTIVMAAQRILNYWKMDGDRPGTETGYEQPTPHPATAVAGSAIWTFGIVFGGTVGVVWLIIAFLEKLNAILPGPEIDAKILLLLIQMGILVTIFWVIYSTISELKENGSIDTSLGDIANTRMIGRLIERLRDQGNR